MFVDGDDEVDQVPYAHFALLYFIQFAVNNDPGCSLISPTDAPWLLYVSTKPAAYESAPKHCTLYLGSRLLCQSEIRELKLTPGNSGGSQPI